MKTLIDAVDAAKAKRVAIALNLLTSSDLTISQIAASSGLSDRSISNLISDQGIQRARSNKDRQIPCTDSEKPGIERQDETKA